MTSKYYFGKKNGITVEPKRGVNYPEEEDLFKNLCSKSLKSISDMITKKFKSYDYPLCILDYFGNFGLSSLTFSSNPSIEYVFTRIIDEKKDYFYRNVFDYKLFTKIFSYSGDEEFMKQILKVLRYFICYIDLSFAPKDFNLINLIDEIGEDLLYIIVVSEEPVEEYSFYNLEYHIRLLKFPGSDVYFNVYFLKRAISNPIEIRKQNIELNRFMADRIYGTDQENFSIYIGTIISHTQFALTGTASPPSVDLSSITSDIPMNSVGLEPASVVWSRNFKDFLVYFLKKIFQIDPKTVAYLSEGERFFVWIKSDLIEENLGRKAIKYALYRYLKKRFPTKKNEFLEISLRNYLSEEYLRNIEFQLGLTNWLTPFYMQPIYSFVGALHRNLSGFPYEYPIIYTYNLIINIFNCIDINPENLKKISI